MSLHNAGRGVCVGKDRSNKLPGLSLNPTVSPERQGIALMMVGWFFGNGIHD